MAGPSKPRGRHTTLHDLVAAGILASLGVHAWAMRCGTELVDEGDTPLEVALKCGTPTFVDQNRWIYNEGPHQFMKVLHFGAGEVQFIENGPYGSSDRWPPARQSAP